MIKENTENTEIISLLENKGLIEIEGDEDGYALRINADNEEWCGESLLNIFKEGFQKGKLEQKKEELSFMKECGINSFKNIEEADSSGFEKEFRRFKQLQKEIGGKGE